MGLEEPWITRDCWFRLHCTLQGIHVTDVWKLTKFHVADNHPMKNIFINDFSNILSKRLIDNNLANGARSVTRANKRPHRPSS